MAFTIERGIVQNLSVDEEKRSASCQVNNIPVNLHRDLTDFIKAGDEVVIVGTMQDEEMRALAIKDISNSKAHGIDSTNYILLSGIGLYIFTMFAVFFIQGLIHHANMPIEAVHTVISLIGLVWATIYLRQTVEYRFSTRAISIGIPIADQ